MNIQRYFLNILLTFSASYSWSQNDGYWDKERATKREIIVSARERIVVKTEDLPLGTTELVFRITLLNQNQQMSNNLVSLLKSIPDPTGISQGTAGAVFLLSKIYGEDKFRYAIFSKESLAIEYKKTGKTTKSCFEQKNPVSQDGNRLSADKSLCVLPNSQPLWFGFQSKNLIMNQKIVVEVVPWVNIKLSSGWNLENRKLIINQCKSIHFSSKIIPTDSFCICILEQLQSKYKFEEFKKLLQIEKTKVYNDLQRICMNQPLAAEKIYKDLRFQANDFMKQGKYKEAVDKINIIKDFGKVQSEDFNLLGYCYLMSKQYSKAIKILKEGENIDDSDLLIQINLAHSYLLNNDFKTAKSIYEKYQNQNINDSTSWTQKVKSDFENFQKLGISSNEFNRVSKLFKIDSE